MHSTAVGPSWGSSIHKTSLSFSPNLPLFTFSSPLRRLPFSDKCWHQIYPYEQFLSNSLTPCFPKRTVRPPPEAQRPRAAAASCPRRYTPTEIGQSSLDLREQRKLAATNNDRQALRSSLREPCARAPDQENTRNRDHVQKQFRKESTAEDQDHRMAIRQVQDEESSAAESSVSA